MTTQRKKRAAIARAFLGFSLLYAVGCAEKEENFPKNVDSEAQVEQNGGNEGINAVEASVKKGGNKETAQTNSDLGENPVFLFDCFSAFLQYILSPCHTRVSFLHIN